VGAGDMLGPAVGVALPGAGVAPVAVLANGTGAATLPPPPPPQAPSATHAMPARRNAGGFTRA
jgi:hypothetical protein